MPRGDRSADDADPPGTGFEEEAALARLLLLQRRRREQRLGAVHFSDPAWDMMLDLFVARVRGEETASSSLVIAASVPQSTALRRIRELVRRGDFVARADPHDGRRTFISLSEPLFAELGVVLRDWRAASAALHQRE
jgi:DNA-binding MarR family transcriptional regulator